MSASITIIEKGKCFDDVSSKVLLARLDTPSQVEKILRAGYVGKLEEFMGSMEKLQVALSFFEQHAHLRSCEDELRSGKTLMAHALTTLSHDFSDRLDAASRQPSASELNEAFNTKRKSFLASRTPLLELISSDQVPLLKQIAVKLLENHAASEIILSYKQKRDAALHKGLEGRGWVLVTREEMVDMEWNRMESIMKRWSAVMHGMVMWMEEERRLVDEIFQAMRVQSTDGARGGGRSVPSSPEDLFVSLASPTLLSLMDFGFLIANDTKLPERLITLLEMYDAARELRLQVQKLFSGGAAVKQDIPSMFQVMLTQLGSAAREIFSEFQDLVENDNPQPNVPSSSSSSAFSQSSSTSDSHEDQNGNAGEKRIWLKSVRKPTIPRDGGTHSDGDVHALTSYVANYIKLLCNKELTYPRTLSVVFGGEETIAGRMVDILNALKKNLEKKGELLNDPILKELFLMNNLDYLVSKINGCDAKNLIGSVWIEKTRNEVEEHMAKYVTKVNGKFQAVLDDDKKDNQTILKRMRSFNAVFDEFCSKQKQWKVRDDNLRTLLTGEIGMKVVRHYSKFRENHRALLDGAKTAKFKIYTNQELETALAMCFGQEKPPSKSKPTGFS